VLVKRKDNRTSEEVKQYYDFFHKNLKSIFKIRAGIEEISIDTDEKEPKQVGDEILGYFKRQRSDYCLPYHLYPNDLVSLQKI
jgi:hypothetical protein